MIKIEIDGVEVLAKEGSSIIENADKLSIPIPRFCYHHKLSVAANCRMCLVHVEKSHKPLPACATPVAEGMKIWTDSKEAVAAQRAVMEFLLINHPLDCPICDQGGECELQDTAMNYGSDYSRYSEPKRAVLDQNLGPLISTDMTRCIHCTRCVRFGDEISGERELGATGRGEDMNIGTYIEQTVDSEVSGNVIDLCPVGALTSKPFRFRARTWEMRQHPSLAPHDCIGANLYLHVYDNAVQRVVPRENESLNEIWISDRDRFSYTGVLHDDRLRKPMLRKQDKWQVVSWVEALKYAVAGVKLILEKYGAEQFAGLVSPSASIEEQYLLQKFMRGLGINNIDHRLRQQDFRMQNAEPLMPNLGVDFAELDKQDTIVIIGSNIPKEIPNAALKIRKAARAGTKVCHINPADYKFNFAVHAKIVTATLIMALTELLDAVTGNDKNVSTEVREIANALQSGTNNAIIMGHLAIAHSRGSELKALAAKIASATNSKFGWFSDGANAAGAWLSGCVPHRLPGGHHANDYGKNAYEMFDEPMRGYLLYGVEPAYDSIFGNKALESLRDSDFVIAVNSYQSDNLMSVADVILPMTQYSEMSGNYINIDGIWQQTKAVTKPFGESRPGWKILRVLANLAEVVGFDYTSVDQVLTEIQDIPKNHSFDPNTVNIGDETANGLKRFSPVALYAVDSLVRRALPLQATKDAMQKPLLYVGVNTAKMLGLASGDKAKVSAKGYSILLTTAIDETIADNAVIIYCANFYTNQLPAFGHAVEVKKC